MTGFDVLKTIGTITSIVRIINALKDSNNSTAVDLFKESCIEAVKQSAPNFADIIDPAEVGVDSDTLVTLLKDIDTSTLTSLEENAALSEIVAIFAKCIILPGHQLTASDLEQRLQPVIKKTFANFFEQLPRNQQATNETILEYARGQSASQDRLIRDTERIKENTSQIEEINKTTQAVHDTLHRQLDISPSAAVEAALEKEHQSAIDNAKDLLKKNKPQSAIDSLENLKQRIWTQASPPVKFNILTNIAAALFALNKEREGAMLVLKAFQYNPEDERALPNRALAHASLGETKDAETYAKKALEKDPVNIHAYATLVEISTDEEMLEDVIAKVPEYLREKPQIAYAISNIAKQRGNLEEARKWREIVVAQEQENISDAKAGLAAILIEQILTDQCAVLTRQFDDSQKEQLKRIIELLTEAWNQVINTELHAVRIGWIINRSMVYYFLGEWKKAIKDIDTALEIEPSHSLLLKNRALLAVEQGEKEGAIEFLVKIQSGPEASEAPILIATILFSDKRFDEAITTLNNFLQTNPSSELQEKINCWLVRIYIENGRFEDAERISTIMRESSPTNILNLVAAAQISNATGKHDEAISYLKDAYKYAQNQATYNYTQDREIFLEIAELADQLYIHELFKEASVLYEKLADTSLNSEWTQWLLKSYYNAGEIGKALEICQRLRAKYGLIKNVSWMEYEIYEALGDLKQAVVIGTEYLKAFPDDLNMQMDMAYLHYRLGKVEAFKQLLELLEGQFDLKDMSLQSCINLVYLHKIASKPKRALDIMYEVRRMHYSNPDAHLKYFGLFFEVGKQLSELLDSSQVQIGTAVCLDRSGETNWYIIEKHDDANPMHNELNVNDALAQQLLGKTVNDEIILRETPFGMDTGKIIDIQSKYTYAFQEIRQEFPDRFPKAEGLWATKLDDSDEIDDSEKFQALLDLADKQHEVSLRIVEAYKENPPIGPFANLIRYNILDTWGLLMSNPNLGIRCCIGNLEERIQARALLENSQSKLVVDLISLVTLYYLEAADTVVKAFGKFGVAQSTIDGLQRIIHEKEVGADREGMIVGKQGDRYVKHIITPEEVQHKIEHLKALIKWIRENCEVHPVTAALQINQLRKRKLDDAFQPCFIDTLLIASQPGHLLLSDDEQIRHYAETGLNSDAKTDFDIDGVWTQVVLEHCVNKNVLHKTQYDKMTIKLVCSNYYYTEFDADVLMEAARQSDWKPSEPYNSLVQALGSQEVSLPSALDVAADFLFELWTKPLLLNQPKSLTFCLFEGLTAGRGTQIVLNLLAKRIRGRSLLYSLAEERILSLIEEYTQTYPF